MQRTTDSLLAKQSAPGCPVEAHLIRVSALPQAGIQSGRAVAGFAGKFGAWKRAIRVMAKGAKRIDTS